MDKQEIEKLLEKFGITTTVRSIGFPINVIAKEEQEINRYAILLIE